MQLIILIIVFVVYVYINYSEFSKYAEPSWRTLIELKYTKESAASLLGILDVYTELNPKFVDQRILREKSSFSSRAEYLNLDQKLNETFINDGIPLGINKFTTFEEKSYLKNLARENNLSIFDIQIQLNTLNYFQKDERFFEINNINEAVDKYLDKFYPELLDQRHIIVDKANKYYDFFKNKN
jgi:hypothetical protein